LLEKESLELLQKVAENGKEAILCGSYELQATAPWILLQQLGYKNILVLKGGITNNGELVDTELAASEATIIDMTAIHSNTDAAQPSAQSVVKKKSEAIIPVRKAASSGGGC
jgi:hypothetical protein